MNKRSVNQSVSQPEFVSSFLSLSLASSSSSNARVSRDRIARREPRNCSCETAKLGGIRTNGIHPDSLIRPSRPTYNYSVYTIKPHRFPRGHAHSPGKTQSLGYATAIATHSPPRPSRKRNLVITSYPPSSCKGMYVIELLIFRFHSPKLTARHLTTFSQRNFKIIQNLLRLIV